MTGNVLSDILVLFGQGHAVEEGVFGLLPHLPVPVEVVHQDRKY